MSRINRLSSSLANQIAAGEVIERPAAAIKELIENALDAGSCEINISIMGGGVDEIRVQDNGNGILAEDLPLALERHATSKIRDIDDLAAISTLGFRGEALASLAAVTELTISSKRAEESHGWEYMIGWQKPIPKPMSTGTIITARSLFATIPARRRFLRLLTTEAAHCLTVVRQAAISSPAIGFSLMNNGRQRLLLSAGGSLLSRLIDIFPVLENNTINIDEEAGGVKLSGYLFASSLVDGGKRIGQYFYVNGRIVRDPMLRRAVSDTLREISHHGEPGYALFLTIPAQDIDVNVHPSKLEVRFSEGQRVFNFIRQVLAKVISSPLGVPIRDPAYFPPSFLAHEISLNSTLPTSSHQEEGRDRLQNTSTKNMSNTDAMRGWEQMFSQIPSLATKNTLSTPCSSSTLIEDEPLGRAIGQMHDIYIIAENHEGLVIVDMHAAHERILYEDLKNAADNDNLSLQPFLTPIMVPLSAIQAETLGEHGDSIIGLSVRLIDDNTAEITAISTLIVNYAEPIILLSTILDDMANFGEGNQAVWERDKIFSSIACHAALRANDRMNLAEMNILLRRMEQSERSGSCNHGRPCWQQIGRDYFDRVFRRGQ